MTQATSYVVEDVGLEGAAIESEEEITKSADDIYNESGTPLTEEFGQFFSQSELATRGKRVERSSNDHIAPIFSSSILADSEFTNGYDNTKVANVESSGDVPLNAENEAKTTGTDDVSFNSAHSAVADKAAQADSNVETPAESNGVVTKSHIRNLEDFSEKSLAEKEAVGLRMFEKESDRGIKNGEDHEVKESMNTEDVQTELKETERQDDDENLKFNNAAPEQHIGSNAEDLSERFAAETEDLAVRAFEKESDKGIKRTGEAGDLEHLERSAITTGPLDAANKYARRMASLPYTVPQLSRPPILSNHGLSFVPQLTRPLNTFLKPVYKEIWPELRNSPHQHQREGKDPFNFKPFPELNSQQLFDSYPYQPFVTTTLAPITMNPFNSLQAFNNFPKFLQGANAALPTGNQFSNPQQIGQLFRG